MGDALPQLPSSEGWKLGRCSTGEHGARVEADGWGRQRATPELELELERARAGEAGSESLHELAVWWQPTTKVHDDFSIGPFVFTAVLLIVSFTLYPSFSSVRCWLLSLARSLSLSLFLCHLWLQQPELRLLTVCNVKYTVRYQGHVPGNCASHFWT